MCVALFLSAKYARLMSQGYRFGCDTFSSLLSSYFARWDGGPETRDKENQDYRIYPSDHMLRAAREAEEQTHKLLPLHEALTGRNNQSMRVNKPFSYQ